MDDESGTVSGHAFVVVVSFSLCTMDGVGGEDFGTCLIGDMKDMRLGSGAVA